MAKWKMSLLLGCLTSGLATMGFLMKKVLPFLSASWSFAYHVSIIGGPGFVVGAMVAGGHQASDTAICLIGTVINVALDSAIWAMFIRIWNAATNRLKS